MVKLKTSMVKVQSVLELDEAQMSRTASKALLTSVSEPTKVTGQES